MFACRNLQRSEQVVCPDEGHFLQQSLSHAHLVSKTYFMVFWVMPLPCITGHLNCNSCNMVGWELLVVMCVYLFTYFVLHMFGEKLQKGSYAHDVHLSVHMSSFRLVRKWLPAQILPFPSPPEDGNRSSLWYVVGFLESEIVDSGQDISHVHLHFCFCGAFILIPYYIDCFIIGCDTNSLIEVGRIYGLSTV
jgi:hypothetical protein